MADTVLTDVLVDLFRADAADVEQWHDNVRGLLRSVKHGTAAHTAFWNEANDAAAAVATQESHRCETATPPNPAAASAGRRRLRQAIAQMFEPDDAKRAREAERLTAWHRFRAEHDRHRAAYRTDRRQHGLSEEPTTGEPEPAVLIHGVPPDDPWAGLADTMDNLDAAMAAQRAATACQNDANLGGLPLGHSRIGGVPDLPLDVAWPKVDGKFVPFVAQLNLAAFPAAHHLLPADGHLYAFVLSDDDHRPLPTFVFLHRGPAAQLVRAERPTDDDEVFFDEGEDGIYDCYPATPTPDPAATQEPGDAALGHLFGEMQDYYGTPGESAGHALASGNDWIVLMEVGSNQSMQWSDSGSLYLLIRREALARLDFTGVLAAVCSS